VLSEKIILARENKNRIMSVHDAIELREFLELMFKDNMKKTAKTNDGIYDLEKNENDLAWSHIVFHKGINEKSISKSKAVRTIDTFMKIAMNEKKAIYFSPNTSCSRLRRDEPCVKYINSITVDIDDEKIDLIGVFHKIKAAGLPYPTAINRTNKGYHVFWILKESVRATWTNRNKYKILLDQIVTMIGADHNAKSVVNLYRIPRNLEWFNKSYIYDFSDFDQWCTRKSNGIRRNMALGSLFETEAIKILMEGVGKGDRNMGCYALAKVCQYEGMDIAACEELIESWNEKNVPKEHNIRSLMKTVKSAYNGDGKLPLKAIYNITGVRLSISTHWIKVKKKREDRTRVHYKEHVADIINYIREEHHGVFEGSQKELSELLDAPLRSIKEAIKMLKGIEYIDQVEVRVIGSGRGSKTIIRVINQKQLNSSKECSKQEKNPSSTKLVDFRKFKERRDTMAYEKAKKSREDRITSHFDEWKEDLRDYLLNHGGQYEGSQVELANRLDAPVRSIKTVVKMIKDDANFKVEILGTGQGAKTRIELK